MSKLPVASKLSMLCQCFARRTDPIPKMFHRPAGTLLLRILDRQRAKLSSRGGTMSWFHPQLSQKGWHLSFFGVDGGGYVDMNPGRPKCLCTAE